MQGKGEKTWISIEIWKQLPPETHKFLLLSTDEQKAIISNHDSLTNRKVNKIDMYLQTRDQDFLALSNCSRGDLECIQDKTLLLDRLRGDEKRSQADIRSVLSTSLSKPTRKD